MHPYNWYTIVELSILKKGSILYTLVMRFNILNKLVFLTIFVIFIIRPK